MERALRGALVVEKRRGVLGIEELSSSRNGRAMARRQDRQIMVRGVDGLVGSNARRRWLESLELGTGFFRSVYIQTPGKVVTKQYQGSHLHAHSLLSSVLFLPSQDK
jgi:hypothetical protein